MQRRNSYVIALIASLAFASAPVALLAQDTPAAATARGWIGMSFLEEGAGGGAIVVAEVIPNAPAREAGLRRGDRIIRWNGRTDVAEAIRAVPLEPGDAVRLSVAARNGQAERELTITAAERPADVAFRRRPGDILVLRGPDRFRGDLEAFRFDRDSLTLRLDSLNSQLRGLYRDSLRIYFPNGRGDFPPRFREDMEESARGLWENLGSLGLALTTGRRAVAGAELTDVTPGLANYFGTDTGALVVRVAPETPAARAGLRDGDVILSVNGEAVDGVADLRWQLSRPGTREFRLEVLRERSRVTITLGNGEA